MSETRLPVRIAVAGAGLIGRKHVAYVRACPDAVLAAVVDPDPGAEALAAAAGAPWYPDLDAMLAAGGAAGARAADGVILAVPTALHEPLGLVCIGAGLPVLVEKPLCHDLAAAERLNTAAEAAGVPVLTGHHRRYNPWVGDAQRLIADGAIGRPVALNVTWCVAKPAPYFDLDWRRAPGGGPVLTNLIHEIDLMRAVIGEIASVSAFTSSAVRGFRTEDTAAIALRFENGVLGTVILSDTAPSPWTWEQGTGENHPVFHENDQNAWRIFGTEAALEFPRLTLWRHLERPDWTTEITPAAARGPRADAYTAQTAHFVDVIRGDAAPVVSGREGQKTLAATLAVFEAADGGGAVEVGV